MCWRTGMSIPGMSASAITPSATPPCSSWRAIFHEGRDRAGAVAAHRLVVRVHSTGRYGASTWYADQFGLDLARNCVAQMNIDSPGCRWATEYRDVTVMSRGCEGFAEQAIQDVDGPGFQRRDDRIKPATILSTISASPVCSCCSRPCRWQKAEDMGYYSVGGCGANIAWHTENDTLEIADKDNLMRDLRVYATALQRLLNNPLHPYDFRALTTEFKGTLDRYAAAAGADANFAPAYDALADLDAALADLQGAAAELAESAVGDAGVRAYNDALLALARELVRDQLHAAGALPHRAGCEGAGIARSGAGARYRRSRSSHAPGDADPPPARRQPRRLGF